MGRKVDKCLRKFGCPLYGAGWISGDVIVVCGGGGKKGSGIKNRLVAARFSGQELSDEIAHLETGDACPLRLVVHPSMKTIVVAMENGGLLAVDAAVEGGEVKLTKGAELPSAATSLGEQKSLAFNSDGTRLVCGGADGSLALFSWPDMKLQPQIPRPIENRVHEKAHEDAVTSCEFSKDGSMLATVGSEGACKIWDVMRGKTFHKLDVPGGGRGVFRGCCFTQGPLTTPPKGLVTAIIKKGEGYVAKFSLVGDKFVAGKMKLVSKEPITAFAVSPCRDMAAIGNSEGEVKVLWTNSLATQQRATPHMIFVTGAVFGPVPPPGGKVASPLLTISGDAGARCTAVALKFKTNLQLYILILLLWLLFFFSPFAEGPRSEAVRSVVKGAQQIVQGSDKGEL